MEGTDPRPSAKATRDKEKDRRLVGKVVAGKYKVLDVLGQGGFGTVFLVEMTSGILGDRLAMKILPREFSQDNFLREQFLNEIRVAMKMVDKHIVQIRDVGILQDDAGDSGGLLYYTMDYIEGQSLAQLISQNGTLMVGRTLRIIRRILPALRTAHDAGIIHRDLKPANVMVEQTADGKEQVRVLDFGIATAIDTDAPEDGPPTKEKRRGFAGSPYYMPPEQFKSKEMGFYTDLYSVGVILYECVTGQRPYNGRTPQEIYNNIKKGPPPAIDELEPSVNSFPGLAELAMKAIERNPEKRFQTAREFFEELNAVMSGTTGATDTTASGGKLAPSPGAGGAAVEKVAAALRPVSEAKAAAKQRVVGPTRKSSPSTPSHRDTRHRKAENETATRSSTRLVIVMLGVVAVTAIAFVFRDQVVPTTDSSKDASSSGVDPGGMAGGTGASQTVVSPDSEATRPDAESTAASQNDAPGKSGAEVAADRRRKQEEKVLATIGKYTREALASLEKGDWKTASERAGEILELRRDEPRGLLITGLTLKQQKSYIDARDWLERALDALPASEADARIEASLSLAETYMRLPQPEWNDARAFLQSIIEKHPKNGRAIDLLGEIYQSRGLTDELEKLVRAAHAAEIDAPKLQKLYQQIFVEKPRRAREANDKLTLQAKAAYAGRKWKQSARLAQKALEQEPTIDLAELAIESYTRLENLGPMKKALAELESLLAKDKGEKESDLSEWTAKLAYLTGRTAYYEYRAQQKPEVRAKSEFQLKRAVELTSRKTQENVFCWANTYLGLLHAQDGRLTAVVEHFKPALSYLDAELIYLHARAYMKLARKTKKKSVQLEAYDLAKKRLLRMSHLSKLDESLARQMELHLGICYLTMGSLKEDRDDFNQARKRFGKAKEKGMKTAAVDHYIALVFVQEENWIRAGQSFRDAYHLDPTPARCIDAVNAFLHANSRSPQAKTLLQDALVKHPDDPALQAKFLEVSKQ